MALADLLGGMNPAPVAASSTSPDFFERLLAGFKKIPPSAWSSLAQGMAGQSNFAQGLARGVAGFSQQYEGDKKRKGLAAALGDATAGFTPQQQAFVRALEPEDAAPLVGQQLFAKPAAPITRTRMAGTTEVQEQLDTRTNTWQTYGQGPRFAPPQPEAPIDPQDIDALHYAAERYRRTGIMPALGNGKEASRARKLVIRFAAQGAEADGQGAAGDVATSADYHGTQAGLTALARRVANIDTAAREANRFADLSIESSNNLPRGTWVPINEAYQLVQAGTSSPALKDFVIKAQGLANAAATVAGRGTPNQMLQEEYMRRLSAADGPAAFKAAALAIKQEAEAVSQSTRDVHDEMVRSIRGGDAASGAQDHTDAQSPPRSALQEGVNTTFGNGQVWTIKNGQPVRIK